MTLIAFLYTLLLSVGIVTIILVLVLAIKKKNRDFIFFALFVLSLTLILFPQIFIYYLSSRDLGEMSSVRIIFPVSGVILLSVFGPLCIFSFTSDKIRKSHIISTLFCLIFILSGIIPFLVFPDNNSATLYSSLTIQILVLGIVLYGFVKRRQFRYKKMKDYFLQFAGVTVFFVPLFIIDSFYPATNFALPLFYGIMNIQFLIFGAISLAPEEPKRKSIPYFGLSEREKDVIEKVFEGLSNQEIADSLFISIKTVETHLGNIYRKAGVKNRKQLLTVKTGSNQGKP